MKATACPKMKAFFSPLLGYRRTASFPVRIRTFCQEMCRDCGSWHDSPLECRHFVGISVAISVAMPAFSSRQPFIATVYRDRGSPSRAIRGNRTGTEADPYRFPAARACRESPSAAFLFWRVPSFRGLPRQPDRHGGRSLQVPAAWACRESPSAAFLFWRSTFFPRPPAATGPARNSGPARRPIPTGFRPHGPVGNRPPRRSSSGAYLLSAASRGNRTGTEANPYRVPAAWACRESPSAAFLFWRVPSFRGLPWKPDRHGGRSLQGSGRMAL